MFPNIYNTHIYVYIYTYVYYIHIINERENTQLEIKNNYLNFKFIRIFSLGPIILGLEQ